MKQMAGFNEYLQKLFMDFAREVKAQNMAGVCLILAPVQEVEGGTIADVQIECAGDPEVMTDKATLLMLTVAYRKITTTERSEVQSLKRHDA